MREQRTRVAVIGAGVGGLVAAAECARRGAEVIVFERSRAPGGKIHAHELGGRRVDAGPTVLTMRFVFDEIFDGALDAVVPLVRAERVAHHRWEDGAALDLWSDVDRSADAIGDFAGAEAARAYRAFARDAAAIYALVRGPFLRAQRPSILDVVRGAAPIGPSALARIDAHRSMWRAIASRFRDPRLRQLFARYATYCGSSPFAAPATLNLIAEVERDGVWLAPGGMIRIAEALRDLAVARGARVVHDAHVASIAVERGRARGVVLASGERVDADAVVVNADVAALAAGLFGSAAARAVDAPKTRSLSAVAWTLVGRAEGIDLARHNVFFAGDPRREFGALFDRAALPDDPTVYVCAQDRELGGDAGARDDERFLFLVNAPANGDRAAWTAQEIEPCERRLFSLLSRCGLTIRPTAMTRTTPADFARRFPATGGALYGAASHGPFSALSRPAARTRVPSLYVAGGSAHPGAGVPMAALSGRLAATALLEDLASTRAWSAAATAGSTSTA